MRDTHAAAPAQVFEPKEWAALTGRSILPKLAYTLDAEFAVNPVAQELQPWQWVRRLLVLHRIVFVTRQLAIWRLAAPCAAGSV